MQISTYTGGKIPVSDIKVGDFIFTDTVRPFYVSSIKKCVACGSWEPYLKFRVKLLGDSSKDPVYTEILSSYDNVEFYNSSMYTVVRMGSTEEVKKVNASWKKFTASISKPTNIIDIYNTLNDKHPDHYSAQEIIARFESVGHIRKLVTSNVEHAIYMLSKDSIQLQLGINDAEYNELLTVGCFASLAKLFVAGESYSDINDRVRSWKTAYNKMTMARMSMGEAFTCSITNLS
jgi:hypothetical protein